MNIASKIFCRVFQTAFRIALPILPYREPEIVNSCLKLTNVFEKQKTKSVLIVTDKGIINNSLTAPLESVLKQNNIAYTIYDETQPNPTVNNVETALKLYHKNS